MASIVLVATFASGCARAGSTAVGGAPLHDPSAPEAGCQAVAMPAVLPAVDVLVDSAALQARITRYLAMLEARPTGYLLLSVAHDAEGVNIRRDVIEHTTTPVVADSIQRLVFAEVRGVESAELPWNVRLRVDFGHGTPSLAVRRSEACAPRPRDASLEARVLSAPALGVRYRRGARERVVLVRLEVTPAGNVRAATVVRGPPMTTDLQQQIADYSRRLFFEPATLDGVPVTGHIDIPLTIRG